MKRIRARYLFPLCLLFLVACHHSKSGGYEFVGKWVNTEAPSDTIAIEQDGDKYVISDGTHVLVGTYDDGMLTPNDGKGKCAYLKGSDTMNCAGVSYKRGS